MINQRKEDKRITILDQKRALLSLLLFDPFAHRLYLFAGFQIPIYIYLLCIGLGHNDKGDERGKRQIRLECVGTTQYS